MRFCSNKSTHQVVPSDGMELVHMTALAWPSRFGSSWVTTFNGDQDPCEIMQMYVRTHTIQPTILDVYRFPEVHPQPSPVVGTTWTELRTQLQIQPQRSLMLACFTYSHIVLLHDFIARKHEKGPFPSHFADEETEGQWTETQTQSHRVN